MATLHEIKAHIRNNDPGYAYCDIGGQSVLFIRGDDPIGYYEHAHPLPSVLNSAGKIAQAMILDVAQGDGDASQQTFYLPVIKYMINSRKAFPKSFKREHKEARDLAEYLKLRPDVFIS